MKKKREFLFLDQLVEFLDNEHTRYSELAHAGILSDAGVANHNIAVGALGMISFVRMHAQQLAEEAMNSSEED